jgi:hypothetical protein
MILSFCKGMKKLLRENDNKPIFFHIFACVSKNVSHYDINHHLFTAQ